MKMEENKGEERRGERRRLTSGIKGEGRGERELIILKLKRKYQ